MATVDYTRRTQMECTCFLEKCGIFALHTAGFHMTFNTWCQCLVAIREIAALGTCALASLVRVAPLHFTNSLRHQMRQG